MNIMNLLGISVMACSRMNCRLKTKVCCRQIMLTRGCLTIEMVRMHEKPRIVRVDSSIYTSPIGIIVKEGTAACHISPKVGRQLDRTFNFLNRFSLVA